VNFLNSALILHILNLQFKTKQKSVLVQGSYHFNGTGTGLNYPV